MDYAQLVADLQNYAQQEQPADAFTAAIPVFIDNAELRIYRELDFLATGSTNASVAFTAGSRELPLAGMSGATVGGFPVAFAYPVVVQGVSAIVPSPSAPAVGTRVRFQLVSFEFIDMVWPTEAITGVPAPGNAYYAMKDNNTLIVAPTPAAAYVAEVTGTWRPAPISATNTQTWLSENLPDLLFIACMVEVSGWMKNFGAVTDDPKMAMTWEARYQEQKKSAFEEEQRRKGQGPGWQPYQAAPFADAQRG